MRQASSIVSLLLLLAAPAYGQPISVGDANETLNQTDQEIAKAKQDLDVVARGYGSPALLRGSAGRVERRLREGEIHFLLGDYLRASIVLLDVVDNEQNRSHPGYDECLYFMAESLRRTRQFSGARRYFEELMPRATGERLKDVVLSLLEIASSTRRYDGVDGYIARLRQSGGLSRPDVDYIHAKMLVESADNDVTRDESFQLFKSIPRGNTVSAQAAYYAGVVKVQSTDYEAAIVEFKEALSRSQAANNQALIELSNLSLGRLYQELGRAAEAVDHYQAIGRNSDNFSEMLFEVAWAHVRIAREAKEEEQKSKSLTNALRMAELLMASSPDSLLFPEARILEGNLQIKLGAQETAYDTFQSIVDRYGGARTKLGQLVSENPDPRQFFDQLVKKDLQAAKSTNFIPPIAVSWAVASPEMQRAVEVMSDLTEAETYASESEELLQVLQDALQGEQRYAMFKGLQATRAKAFGVENRMVLLNRRLLRLERGLLEPYLSTQELASLDAARTTRSSLEEDVQALPQTEEEVEVRRVEISDAYQGAERRVFKQSLHVSSMRAQLVAVEVWVNQNRDRLGPDELKLMDERIRGTRDELQAVEADLGELQSNLRSSAALYGGEAGRGHARKVRADYLSAMQREGEQLALYRSKAPGEVQGVANRIDGQRQMLVQMTGDLDRLQSSLDAEVDSRVAEIKEALDEEATRLADYRTRYRALRGDTDGSLGPIAREALNSVAEQFQALVLKADVGIIDVAWARKQSATGEVGKLVEEQQLRVRELENEFSDVLNEE